MKNNITEIVFVLDRSGSMAGVVDDTIGGFNAFIEQQKKEDGVALVSTVLFNHESKVIHDRVNLLEVKEMDRNDYRVGGCTALLDAVGDAIHHISSVHKYLREEDVPEKTIFIITTDGMENASHEYNKYEIRKIIERKKELGWEFIFLGANIDAFAAASNIGIDNDHTSMYMQDKLGTKANFASVNNAVLDVRKRKKINKEWKKLVEDDYNNRHK